MYKILFSLSVLLLIISCQPKESTPEIKEVNPAAQGFNASESDSKAIAIADEVMEAMGGREAWDQTKTLKWTFFGNRQHEWNKADKRAKIYSPRGDISIDMSIDDMSGTVSKGGVAYTDADSIAHFLDLGHKWWINDSYWLVMPFKLKDSGVTLKYEGKDTTQNGRSSDVLNLTFESVGVTPQNKYLVYVDDSSRLVTQWDFYTNATDSLPRFQSAWEDYAKYGNLLLSGGSIGGRKLTDISLE